MLLSNPNIIGKKGSIRVYDELKSVLPVQSDDLAPVYLNNKCKFISKKMVEVIKEIRSSECSNFQPASSVLL